ncbi:hypothetical protein [Aeromicrobium duanguangcaii]|uniref:Uncharacterized protein n=1 Tax=Aeromicrobium duanguangcaii TaxID=2968086 RepID=A0ABY5KHJ3_9ACTN|nr:hypothetical protein [Aeromicrobium duanguangcaii]MCD9153120.1 hypothetical protein [Aeromicrobium duanguangcaii]UUI69779.1 hypothetical protein NP095_06710 [Aeromicrobium duanguangcaii]
MDAVVEACASCHSVVPDEWRRPDTTVTCVAMAGARSSGKSIYLGVLRQQLALWVEETHGTHLELLGDSERHYWQRYGAPLFDEGVILGATAEIAADPDGYRPLIFRFVDAAGRSQILVVRDVAGEDLEDLVRRRSALEFVKRADAVVALIDPLKMDRLRESLHGIIQPGDLGGDGVEVVLQVLNLLTDDGRLPVPEGKRVAVAVSKLDILQQIRDVEGAPLRRVMVRAGSPLQRDPSMRTAGFDRRDADLVDAEVDSLLVELVGPKLRNLLRQKDVDHRYFAVSALGAHPEGQSLNSAGIAPFRVLDPVKWILS